MGRQRAANGNTTTTGGMTGKVVRVVSDRGFAFIQGADGRDYFAHRMDVEDGFDYLQQGVAVRFSPKEAPKGPRAEQVSRVESAAGQSSR